MNSLSIFNKNDTLKDYYEIGYFNHFIKSTRELFMVSYNLCDDTIKIIENYVYNFLIVDEITVKIMFETIHSDIICKSYKTPKNKILQNVNIYSMAKIIYDLTPSIYNGYCDYDYHINKFKEMDKQRLKSMNKNEMCYKIDKLCSSVKYIPMINTFTERGDKTIFIQLIEQRIIFPTNVMNIHEMTSPLNDTDSRTIFGILLKYYI